MTLLGTLALRYTLRAKVGSDAFTRSPSSSEHSNYDTNTATGVTEDLERWRSSTSWLQPLLRCPGPAGLPCPPSAISPAVACDPAAAQACTAPRTQTCWADPGPAEYQSTATTGRPARAELGHSETYESSPLYAEFPKRDRMERK